MTICFYIHYKLCLFVCFNKKLHWWHYLIATSLFYYINEIMPSVYEGYTDRVTRIWMIIKVYKLYYSIDGSWFLEALIIFALPLSYVFHSGSLCTPPWKKKYIFSTLKCHLSLFVPFPGFYDFQSSFRLSQCVKIYFWGTYSSDMTWLKWNHCTLWMYIIY